MEGEGEECLWLTEVVTERSWNTRITLHFFAITLPHFLLGTLPGTIANGSVILEQVHLRYPILAALYRLSLPTSLQVCVIGLNDTTPCTIGHACSSVEHSTAELVMMIQAVVGDDRPPTYIDAPNSDYAVDCETAQLCQVMTPHEPPVAERQMHRRPEG